MSSVLYDHPGPRTVARHRLYSVLAGLLVAVPVGYFLWRMWDRGQFDYELWEPFVTPAFIDYLRPLLGAGMPETARLRSPAVAKILRA